MDAIVTQTLMPTKLRDTRIKVKAGAKTMVFQHSGFMNRYSGQGDYNSFAHRLAAIAFADSMGWPNKESNWYSGKIHDGAYAHVSTTGGFGP